MFGNGLRSVPDSLWREKPEETPRWWRLWWWWWGSGACGGGGGRGGRWWWWEVVGCSRDESRSTIFHGRQKHLAGYQFGAA